MNSNLKYALMGIAFLAIFFAARHIYIRFQQKLFLEPSVVWVEERIPPFELVVRKYYPRLTGYFGNKSRFDLYAANEKGNLKRVLVKDLDNAFNGIDFVVPKWGLSHGRNLFLLKIDQQYSFYISGDRLYSMELPAILLEPRYISITQVESVKNLFYSTRYSDPEFPIYTGTYQIMHIQDGEAFAVNPYSNVAKQVKLPVMDMRMDNYWVVDSKSSAGADGRYVLISSPIIYEGSWPAGKSTVKIAYFDMERELISAKYRLAAQELSGRFYPIVIPDARYAKVKYDQYSDAIIKAVCIAPKTSDGSAMYIVSCRSQSNAQYEKDSVFIMIHNPETETYNCFDLPGGLNFLSHRQELSYYILQSWYNNNTEEVIVSVEGYDFYLIIFETSGKYTKLIESHDKNMFCVGRDWSLWYADRALKSGNYLNQSEIFNIRRLDLKTGKDVLVKGNVLLTTMIGSYVSQP